MKFSIVFFSPLLALASPAFSPASLHGQGAKVARGENYCCNSNVFFIKHAQRLAADTEVSGRLMGVQRPVESG
ncbi:hypothetical protein MGYG_00270 [Nannizzia gypsea CBS 118893]|uniref:Uncharacterized protein n=1 Tax=Arthroderma gypseum (strain ATCC MYA-4604 / CBS 118893) TaxID=535722 RepID=E5QYD6_ARTGP|nr:hypothetical protein MGYG_00270 [Nannizzia gypsea CBS 118893]EFQ97228.1 hypothetical protein MGYG_00270 [Nannizzia gypsea CBS 118893]